MNKLNITRRWIFALALAGLFAAASSPLWTSVAYACQGNAGGCQMTILKTAVDFTQTAVFKMLFDRTTLYFDGLVFAQLH